jgi:hypothetical protein
VRTHLFPSRDVGNIKDPSSNRKASFKQGTTAEKAEPQQQKHQQQQELCGKPIKKVAGNVLCWGYRRVGGSE